MMGMSGRTKHAHSEEVRWTELLVRLVEEMAGKDELLHAV